LTFTKIVPAAPPVARFGEVFVFFENGPYMDHGKAIRVEIGGVPEAPEFLKIRRILSNFQKTRALQGNPGVARRRRSPRERRT